MNCPHPDIQCEDCQEYPCILVHHTAALPLPRTDCTRCPLARVVADFMRSIGEEEAYRSGDVESWEMQSIKEARR
jgi:hypothetical protein